jgi:deoxyhypusine synthase
MGDASFSAIRLARAVKIWKKMLGDKECYKFLCVAGALIPGGMKEVIRKTIENKLVDGIIATGAILTHDLIEAFGEPHYHGSDSLDDLKLHKEKINRIYNSLLPTSGYLTFEEEMKKILKKLPQERMSAQEFIFNVGQLIDDEKSITGSAAKNNIPIFCPSFSDSILGFQAWMHGQDNGLDVNPMLDQKKMLDIVWDNKKVGAIILGGGVPKHYVALAAQVTGKGLNYGVQITLDRPEHGGVSGAPLQEAKSWGKLAEDAEATTLTCDVTIALPIIVASLLD